MATTAAVPNRIPLKIEASVGFLWRFLVMNWYKTAMETIVAIFWINASSKKTLPQRH
jgi:hypothetical protein